MELLAHILTISRTAAKITALRKTSHRIVASRDMVPIIAVDRIVALRITELRITSHKKVVF